MFRWICLYEGRVWKPTFLCVWVWVCELLRLLLTVVLVARRPVFPQSTLYPRYARWCEPFGDKYHAARLNTQQKVFFPLIFFDQAKNN